MLENARICETLGEATADLHYAFATTGRAREFIKPIMTPERASEHGRALMGQGQKVGFLFGAERTGLETEEIVGANAILSVPVNPEFKSINLAQCVLLVAYEWRRLGDDTPPEQMDDGKTAPADMGQLNGMLDFLVGELDHSGFFWPEGKRPSMEATLRSAFARQSWTDADLRMMYGAFRALAKRRRSINR